jgi:hypothetical protein
MFEPTTVFGAAGRNLPPGIAAVFEVPAAEATDPRPPAATL